ncbi:MAG: hypothetical protein NWE94_01645 [Candidatus Bathyarchaeota archaeon]|nr:hypothetical protein [Candidatus Bathyarchaeota archaeon]
MRSSEIAMIGICAALYAVIGLLTSFGLSLGGVAFWPAVVIPSVFAVLFGPWVGGTGAAIGIFIRDVIYHGDPLLSLSAGVTGNFAMCFLIGYISRTSLSRKKLGISVIVSGSVIIAGILLPTLLLPAESALFTGLRNSEIIALLAAVVAASVLAVAVLFAFKKEWRNFSSGALIGQGVGATIVAIVVWLYSNLFFSPGGYFKSPLPSSFVPLVFVWTVATEIPFVLVLGPPIIKAAYRAFPALRLTQKTEKKAT